MLAAHGVYPVLEGIADFDLNTEIEEYEYDGRTVFRGNMDPELSKDGRSVYWLYEDDTRVGLVEHTSDAHTCYWYRNNPYSTLFQEEWQVYDETIWNLLPQKAYDECMRHGWTTIPEIRARTQLQIATLSDFTGGAASAASICVRCGDLCAHKGCVPHEKKSSSIFSVLFSDDDGTIYVPPSDSKAYATLRRRGAAAAGAGAATTTGGASTTGGSAVAPPAYSSSSSSAANAARAPPATTDGASSST